ncbi:MAG: ABC transporter ATP-binding protein, partial [Burkholderiales bacterium]|nr:ABC transporter ATP-binding protein [Burkholderiales bacterium]
MSRIDFKNLCKRYLPGMALTIKDANLTIGQGEFCVFVGPSGCGKSTLLRMVAGLESISSGDLSIAGKRVNDLPPAQRGVAMVFQKPTPFPMSIYDNVAFGVRLYEKLGQAEMDARVEAALRRAALWTEV